MGALSGAGAGLRLWRSGRPAQLGPTHSGFAAHWKEREPRSGVRRLVPQSSAAPEAVRLQWRRLSHVELHPDARHDDSRSHRRPLPAGAAPHVPFKRLLTMGALTLALGLLLHWTGLCPIVKRIWTPSWTLFSGGACFLLLSGFLWIIDVRGYRAGRIRSSAIRINSIAAYLIAELLNRFVEDSFRIHLGRHAFAFLGTGLEPLLGAGGSAPDLLAHALLDAPAEAFSCGCKWQFPRRAFSTASVELPSLGTQPWVVPEPGQWNVSVPNAVISAPTARGPAASQEVHAVGVSLPRLQPPVLGHQQRRCINCRDSSGRSWRWVYGLGVASLLRLSIIPRRANGLQSSEARGGERS